MSTDYAASRVSHEGAEFWLQRNDDLSKSLVVKNAPESVTAAFEGRYEGDLFVAPATGDNAAALRSALPWLKPRLWGL